MIALQSFQFKPFSKKQRMVLNWWADNSPVKDYDGIIADGAIRSGKSLCMSLSFSIWAMSKFSGQNFAICGKTVGSFRRNVLTSLIPILRGRGYKVEEKRTDNLVTVSKGQTVNYFYIFGGRDERSQDLIQGITLAGVFLDEVALMPESFVNQATGRCSTDGAKLWMNCNPASPMHWLKKNWIDRAKEKNLLYIHFTMNDNASLSEHTKERYRNMYSGVFYDRYILGLWAIAEGLVYPMYSNTVPTLEREYTRYYVSMDYGIQNPTAMILWGLSGYTWYAVKEYYHSGRETGQQKTDADYYEELERLTEGLPIRNLIIDPSASSFIALVNQKHRFRVWKAHNQVVPGIQRVAQCLTDRKILINDCCKRTIQEFGLYSWQSGTIEDAPIKENDHAMDAVRYFVNTTEIWRDKR